jgi:hypothetical protein
MASHRADETIYDRTTAAVRRAGESSDAEAFIALLAPNVVVRSPITQLIRFEGHDQAADLFRRIFTMIDDIRIDEFVGPGQRTQVMLWKGSVNGTYLEEANVLRFGDDGLITEMTVFMRAVPGLLRLASEIAPSLARRHSRLRAVAVGAALRSVSFLYRTAEPVVIRLAGAGVPVSTQS